MINVIALLTTKHAADGPQKHHGEQHFWRERGPEYARKLFAGVGRHLPTPFRPMLITDTPTAVPLGVEYVEFPWELREANARGWWAKLAMFRPGLTQGNKSLYLDLDNVVGGDLTPLVSLTPDPLIMMDDVVYPGMRNGSTILWNESLFTRKLYQEYVGLPRAIEAEFSEWPHASDQAFIADRFKRTFREAAPTFQAMLPPGYILNSRKELELGADWSQTALVFGSWNPKPHNSDHPYYARHWR